MSNNQTMDKVIKKIEREERDKNIVVLCTGCDGYLLKGIAIERRGLRWNETKERYKVVKSYFCKTCSDRLDNGLIIKEDR